MTVPQRFASVDALRGLSVAAMLLVNDPGDWGHVYAPLEHAEWNGCTFADYIFPLFLFIVGVSLALSIAPRLASGLAPATLRREVLWRALRIIALGLLLNLVAHVCIAQRDFRLMGVLQRIGLCFAGAGLVALGLQPRRVWALMALLLLGYTLALLLGGTLDFTGNLPARLDTWLLGAYAYQFDPLTGQGHDPEGLLSTLPALATTLLGLVAGGWLRAGAIRRLSLAGLLSAALGLLWSWVIPLNKALWTPSYVLWTAGVAMMLLAAAHVLIDRRGWPALGRSLGNNAIVAYAGAWLMVCLFEYWHLSLPLYHTLFADPLTPRFGPWLPSLAYALGFAALWWLLLWACERRGWRLKI